MKKFFSAFLTTVLVSFCLFCGKKGDVLPPLVRFPQAVEDIQAVQKADRIVLSWKNPTTYDDGSSLSEIELIEIWIFERKEEESAGTKEVQAEEFQQKATLYLTIEKDQMEEYLTEDPAAGELLHFHFLLSGKDFLSTTYTFGLRVKDRKRYSPFSALVSLKPVTLPFPPEEVKAEVFADRIEITWKPSPENKDPSSPSNIKGYNVYRSESEEAPQRRNARLIEEEKYADRDFVFGQEYRYFVRASVTERPPYLESEDSAAVTILAEDTFAPGPPEGLISVTGQDFLALSWDANNEEDLAGYRVWRREEGTEDIRLLTPDPIKERAYTDRAVEKGRMYAYAVTALDRSGNESRLSKILIDGIRERMP